MPAPELHELDSLLPGGREPDPDERDVVQVAVRVPRELRSRAHEAAESRGVTLTQFVGEAITDACDRTLDPAADFAARVAASIQSRLAAAVDDGSWDEAVCDYTADDPQLAI